MEHIKRIKTAIVIRDYLVTFSYETIKGHHKEQQRIVRHLTEDVALGAFKEWSKKIRTMSNVKILGIVLIKDTEQNVIL